jgi:hypothetical protein
VIKSGIIRWARHVASVGEKRKGVYRVLARKPEGKKVLGRPRLRWEDNIKVDLREVNWIDVAQDSARRRALVYAEYKVHYAEYNTVSKIRYILC